MVLNIGSSEWSIVSFNARGIRDRKKRRAIFRHMHVKYPRAVIVIQESHSTAQSEKIWTMEWGGTAFFSHGTELARGTCVLVPKGFPGDVALIHSDLEGRMIALMVSLNGINVNLVGIHAPTQSNGRHQIDFYQNLSVLLQTLDASCPLILCGDMNVHLCEIDTGDVHYRETRAAEILGEIIDEFGLRDIWRERNPTIQRFTWRRCHPLQQSRLDYFLISDMLCDSQHVVKAEINPGVNSDHSIISLVLQLAHCKRGPGLWRFNLSLLDHPEVTHIIKEEIGHANNLVDSYAGINETGLLLEVLSGNIRAICTRKSKQIAKDRRLREKQLESDVQLLEERLASERDSDILTQEYVTAKTELDDFKNEAAVRAMLRTKSTFLELGERPSRYFLNLEKKKSAERTIKMLKGNDGSFIAGDKNILRFCKDYYENV